MKAKLKKRYWKIIGFTSLFAASLISAITVPLVMESKKQYYLNSNHSADTLEGNKSRINYYIDNYLYPNRYNLSGLPVCNCFNLVLTFFCFVYPIFMFLLSVIK